MCTRVDFSAPPHEGLVPIVVVGRVTSLDLAWVALGELESLLKNPGKEGIGPAA